MFAMTSMGGKVDNRVNDGRGPYIFRLNGQTHHRIGTLLPNNGEDPQFAQLYFCDTENGVQHKMNAFSSSPVNKDLDPSIIDALIQMFNESNNLVKIFHGREYNLPTCFEIVAIIVGDIGVDNAYRDIVVELKGGLHRINELHPSYMALQYPLLFPYGEDGFRLGILCRNINEIRSDTNDFQFDVDAYTRIEAIRLMWVKNNQEKLRIELYTGLKGAVMRGDTTPASVGKDLFYLQVSQEVQAHINVEWCNRSRSIKYLFKYITKGPDRATLILEENLHFDASTGMQNMTDTDEVKGYLNCRYVSAIEACWRIFEFEIHYRQPAVQRLSFHIENQQPVIFKDSEYLDDVIDRQEIRKSKFTEWMKANELYEEARELTYSKFPTKWVWHKRDKEWRLRKSRRCIGRIYYAHPASGERFYLRMLLNVVKGARSFKELRTINNVVYSDFKSACYALGLLDDDKEWHEALNHASHWASGKQLHILYRQRAVLRYDNLNLDHFQLQNYALSDIEQIMIRNGRSLREFETIPYPNTMLLRQCNNRILQEELDYDRDSLAVEHIELFNGLNIYQRNIYDVVIDSVLRNKGDFLFVYGHGGSGKTYLWKTIICRLRSEGKIVIAVASFGIATLLLPGGRTAHSRFQIPIIVTDSSTCGIKQGSQIAELMTKVSLIIWDEAPMAHRNCFEAVDHSLRDILRFTDNDSADKPFGGKTVVLGGDFRQILPVVAKGRREQIVEASINKSSLWNNCRVFVLTKNMRLAQNPGDIAAREFA
ncbi:uncharacterized protein LOC142628812 [Castanea sativa]|uniref:uncharacterized protein LOC142628812 n=1 Tax=Castanea sativa TaxID=21020 RepID=UPI003F64F9F7